MRIGGQKNSGAASMGPVWHQVMPHFELHLAIRKALCALMTETLLSLGRMDEKDDREVAQSCRRAQELLDFCTVCAANENLFPIDSSSGSGFERRSHDVARLRRLTQSLRTAPEDLRAKTAIDLHRQMSLFLADYVSCMYGAEPTCSLSYGNNESIEGRVNMVGAMAPEALAYTFRWLVPLMNPMERLAMLLGIWSNEPAPVFDAALEMVRARLNCVDWTKLMQGLASHEAGCSYHRRSDDKRNERAVGPMLPMLDARVQTAIQAIHAKPEHPWTVSSLAALSCLSRAAFTTRFRRQTMRSPMDYLANWRVQLAARFLGEEKLSLDQIATRVGYSSGAILARAYKRILGVSPRGSLEAQRTSRAEFLHFPPGQHRGRASPALVVEEVSCQAKADRREVDEMRYTNTPTDASGPLPCPPIPAS